MIGGSCFGIGESCEIQVFNPGGGLRKTMFLSVRTSKNDVSFGRTSKNDVSFGQTSKNDVSFGQDFEKRCFFRSPPWIENLDFAPSAWADSVVRCAFQLCSHWCLHSAFSDHSSPEAQDDRNSARSTSASSAVTMIVAMGHS